MVNRLYCQLTECVPRVHDFISSPESPFEIIRCTKPKFPHSKSEESNSVKHSDPERFPLRTITCDAISSDAFAQQMRSKEVLFHFLSTRCTRSVIFGCYVRRHKHSRASSSASTAPESVDKLAVMVVSPVEMYLVSPLYTQTSFFGRNHFPTPELQPPYNNFDVNIGAVVFGYWNHAISTHLPGRESQHALSTNSRDSEESAHSGTPKDLNSTSKESFESVSFMSNPSIHATASNYRENRSLERFDTSCPVFEAWDWVHADPLTKNGTFKDRYNTLDLWIRSLYIHEQTDHKTHCDESNRGMRIKLKTSLPISIYRPWIRQLKIGKKDDTRGPFSMCAFFSRRGCLGETLRWTNVSLIRLQCSVYRESMASSLRDPLDGEGECNLLLQTAERYNIGRVLQHYLIGIKGMQSYRVFPKHVPRTCVFEMRFESYPFRASGSTPMAGTASRGTPTEARTMRKCIVLTFVPNSITHQSAIKANVLTSIVKRMSKQISLDDLYNSLSETEPSYSKTSKRTLDTICNATVSRPAVRKRYREISVQKQVGPKPFRPRRRSSRIRARQSSHTIRDPSRPTKIQ